MRMVESLTARTRPSRLGALIVTAFVALAACSGGSDSAEPPSADSSPDAVAPPGTDGPDTTSPDTAPTITDAPPSTAPPEPFEPPTVNRLVVTGPEEMVFDWTTDRCEDEHIPDIATRAYRDVSGNVQLTVSHYISYRMIGPDFDNLVSDCSQPQLRSDFDPDPSQFNDSELIGSTYTLDGQRIYAIVHNEYRGDTHGAARPDQCETGERLRCLDTSFTLAVSDDAGATFSDIAPAPNHLIATFPSQYDDDGVPSGIRQPSTVIKGPDDYFYLHGNISAVPDQRQWICAMRTKDLDDPASWRYWDGNDYVGEFSNPYLDPDASPSEFCTPLAEDQLSGSLGESLIYDERIGRFVSVGVSFDPSSPEPKFAVYYSTSPNLIDWSLRELLIEVPINNTVDDPDNETVHAYPALIDPDSSSLSFDTSDGELYLYMSRFNFGGNGLDRDLLRWPIEFQQTTAVAPAWGFDTDGDFEGWTAAPEMGPVTVVDGGFAAAETEDDPWMSIGGLAVPAGFDQVTIRMRAAPGGRENGQVFFTTDVDPSISESKSGSFVVNGDGEFHEYVLDFSDNSSWDGTIRSLRFDPIDFAGRAVTIDSIRLSAS
jgi:hypothetical protein